MKNLIGFMGRFSIVMMTIIGLEGFMTFGSAYDFSNYSPIGTLFQCFMFCLGTWLTTEWYYESLKK